MAKQNYPPVLHRQQQHYTAVKMWIENIEKKTAASGYVYRVEVVAVICFLGSGFLPLEAGSWELAPKIARSLKK